MSKTGGTLLTVTGFIACPCHLPITLPILLSLVGGTTVGTFVATHTSLVYGLAASYFVLAIIGAYYLFTKRRGEGVKSACQVTLAKGKHGTPASLLQEE